MKANYKEIAKYIAENKEKVIQEIKNKKSHLNKKIEPYLSPDEESEIIKFAHYKYWSNSECVNVFYVTGTAHPGYIGLTWIDMLQAGIRMDSVNLPLLKENPDYYFEYLKKQPDMHYTKINDKLYISGEGNHRTSIAKVLFYYTGDEKFGGVIYNEYKIDFSLYEKFKELSDYFFYSRKPIKLILHKRTVKREDNPGWYKEYYDLRVEIFNFEKNKNIIIPLAQIIELEKEIKNAGFLDKFFKRGKFGKILW